jgi:GH24 family phage-related lysozyme (muramidase)
MSDFISGRSVGPRTVPFNPTPGGAESLRRPDAPRQTIAARDRIVDDLLRWEGNANHLYLDTHGLVTVGIGHLLRSPAAAQALPFIDERTGHLATKEDIAAAFRHVGQDRAGCRAEHYAKLTHLRLSDEVVREIATSRLENEFLPGLRREFPHFDDYPSSAQRALVDMAYNLGVGGLGHFHKLRASCEAGDWAQAATECHRRTCRAERNDWTQALFLVAARTNERT